MTGSTGNAIAARAAVPVVAVPEDWHPGAASRVTAAVQDSGEASELVRHAFEQARLVSADLAVLHAWGVANGFQNEVVDQEFRQAWEARSRHELSPALEPLDAAFPDVSMEVVVRHAATSRLVVLGRRHHRLPWEPTWVGRPRSHRPQPLPRHAGPRSRQRDPRKTLAPDAAPG